MCTNPIYCKVVDFRSGHDIHGNDVWSKKIVFLRRDEIDDFYELKNSSLFNQNIYITLPCRKCYECQIQNSKEWALRCMFESKLYKDNCFITLTYSETNGTLNHRDVQLFLKRLRKFFHPLKIRYFGCGEYGSRGLRPHYHLILFNIDFKDKVFFKRTNKKEIIYRSKTLENLWPFGYSSIGEVNELSVKYCAKYMSKDNRILDDLYDEKTGEYVVRKKPYIFMSLKPGIGLNYFLENYSGENELFLSGKEYSIPQYFLDKLDDCAFMRVKNKRLIIGSLSYKTIQQNKSRNLIYKKRLYLFAK